MHLQDSWLCMTSLALPAQFRAVTEISVGVHSDSPVRLTMAVPLVAFTLMDRFPPLVVAVKTEGAPPLVV